MKYLIGLLLLIFLAFSGTSYNDIQRTAFGAVVVFVFFVWGIGFTTYCARKFIVKGDLVEKNLLRALGGIICGVIISALLFLAFLGIKYLIHVVF